MGILSSIKNDAKKSRATIQTSEEAELEKLFNKLFYLQKKPNEECAFVKQVMTRGLESQERVGLHASSLLCSKRDFCQRQLVLSLIYKQSQGDNISVGLMRIFEEGNAIHEKWQRLFLRGGYAQVKDLDYTQFNKKLMMSYTPDVILRIPEFYDGDMVVEIKSVNTYQFGKMSKHPTAWKQCQWYMHQTGLKKGIVLSDNKNSQQFKVEVWDYDYKFVEPYVKRGEATVLAYTQFMNTGKLPDRPEDAKSPACKRCEKCHMRDACWNVGMGRVEIGSTVDCDGGDSDDWDDWDV